MGSPYLEDFNFLLDLKDQMGLEFSQDGIENFIPNATKCMNWQGVKLSHKTNGTLVITMEDIYGITILFALGIGIAIVCFLFEWMSKKIIKLHLPVVEKSFASMCHITLRSQKEPKLPFPFNLAA